MSEALADALQTAAHWNAPRSLPQRTRWWQSKAIVRHINRRIAGEESDGTAGGDLALLRAQNDAAPFGRAISVGCGTGYHELQLLKAGVVEHFDLVEIAASRVAAIHASAAAMGLSARISVSSADPFAGAASGQYDLVYWRDALHHMNPTLDAVAWSRRVLHTGGLFYMHECVAPSYMQWSDHQLDLVERVRRMLPARYLDDPHQPGRLIPLRRSRPTVAGMRAADPSECVDSANILPSVRAVFPNAALVPAGGIVYMLALNDILANLDEERDDGLLAALLAIDDLYSDAGDFVYAVAHARKLDPAAAYA
ncbi:class I SAM-dependent methyltransferase [Massilia genomosp. 1]|uniref:Methyltransferase domain-containing protein n=1 Tax=Massilia genomosp. 1 TaxID=2609280 RepID=A0ABX0MUV8_9BURK|nr:class I SAM-dependent methyltransferase [Massilia genomosp. 1]NHZ64071.1 methyltransferase domain-containing protein [Massilia genomosp. 1]